MSPGLSYFLEEWTVLGIPQCGSADGPSGYFKAGVELCNVICSRHRGTCEIHPEMITLLFSLQDTLIENDIILHDNGDNKSNFEAFTAFNRAKTRFILLTFEKAREWEANLLGACPSIIPIFRRSRHKLCILGLLREMWK